MYMYTCINVYMYMYMYTYVCTCVYVYVYNLKKNLSTHHSLIHYRNASYVKSKKFISYSATKQNGTHKSWVVAELYRSCVLYFICTYWIVCQTY